MKLDDISPELQAKARTCKTPEDVLALAKEAGYKLSDDELEAVAGGDDSWFWCDDQTCDRDMCLMP